MKGKTANQKQSNKGFTLVEVLVAILILSIIVVPLLSAFVMGAKTNAKARQTLRATTLAQNAMEELKAYSLETSASHYNLKTGNSVVSDAEVSYETVFDGDKHSFVTVTKDAETEELVIEGRKKEQYDFVAGGVKQENAKFDVEISVRKHAGDKGSYEKMNINSMNRSDCAYFAQERNAHSVVVEEYVTRNENYYSSGQGALKTREDILAGMKRIITIDVNGGAGNSETVKVTYTYEAPVGTMTADQLEYTEYTTIFDNYASKKELKAIYLYYYPLYGGENRDTVVINNKDNLDVDVYLIKMKDENYTSWEDAAYNLNLQLNENKAMEDGGSNVKVCTNVANLLSTYSLKEPLGMGVVKTLRTSGLGNSEEVQTLYDVTINIYKQDAIEVTGEGTEKSLKFDETKKISTFTGTVLDKAD